MLQLLPISQSLVYLNGFDILLLLREIKSLMLIEILGIGRVLLDRFRRSISQLWYLIRWLLPAFRRVWRSLKEITLVLYAIHRMCWDIAACVTFWLRWSQYWMLLLDHFPYKILMSHIDWLHLIHFEHILMLLMLGAWWHLLGRLLSKRVHWRKLRLERNLSLHLLNLIRLLL